MVSPLCYYLGSIVLALLPPILIYFLIICNVSFKMLRFKIYSTPFLEKKSNKNAWIALEARFGVLMWALQG